MNRRPPALILCLFYIFSLLHFSGCNGDDRGSGAGYLFNDSLIGNPKTLDPQLAADTASRTVIGNLFDGLYRLDKTGNVTPDVAESCEISADGLTYTVRLRQNCFWLSKNNDSEAAPQNVTATDFVFAFYRIFNPEIGSPFGEDFRCLKNAAEILSGSCHYEALGVEATDLHTLRFTLAYPNANFLSLLATTAAMPCCASFYYNTKGRYGLDEDSVISNGAFYLTKWFYDPYGKDNVIYLKRNVDNSAYDPVLPSSLTFYIVKDEAEALAKFKDKQTDSLVTTDPAYAADAAYRTTAAASRTLGLIFNPQHPQYSNASLRKALALGLSRSDYQAELTADVSSACALVPPAVSLLGKPYREHVAENSFLNENADEAVAAYQQAMTELNASSLETAQILVPAGLTDYAVLHRIVRRWNDLFGFYVGIEEVPPAEYHSRLEAGSYTIALYALSADWGSVPDVLETYLDDPLLPLDTDAAAQLSALLAETRSLASLNESIELFRSAEALILGENNFIPLFYKQVYLVTRPENEDIRLDPFTGQVFYRAAKYFE